MRYGRSGRRVRRIRLDAQQELGADEQTAAAPARCPASKLPSCAPFTVEREQRLDVGVRRPDGDTRGAPARAGSFGASGLFDVAGLRAGSGSTRRCAAGSATVRRPSDRTGRRSRRCAGRRPSAVSAMFTPAGYGRRNGRRAVSASADVCLTNATCTSRAPAFTGTRTSQSRSARLRSSWPCRFLARPPPRPPAAAPPARVRRAAAAAAPGRIGSSRAARRRRPRCRLPAPRREGRGAVGTGQREQLDALAVDAHLELLRLRVDRHLLVEIARQLHANRVLRVHRERVADRRRRRASRTAVRAGDRPARDRPRRGSSRRSETAAVCRRPCG